MSLIIDGTSGVTFNDSSLQGAAASPYVLKNRIINGDMRIDQRNAGASTTPTASGYTLDRWRAGLSVTSKFSVQQSSTAPTGFNNSLLVTSLSAYTVGSGEQFTIAQRIEGYNIADLGWGTANAKTITISFWVRSSLTGTFGGALRNNANDRSYPFTYTISSANTWEQKTITVAGETTGTWETTTSTGVYVSFALAVGSTLLGTPNAWASTDYVGATGQTQILATNGATFYITGVQLEVGSTATPFERRLYNQELANCQRYFEKSYNTDVAIGTASTAYSVWSSSGSAGGLTTAYLDGLINYKVTKRATPTMQAWDEANGLGTSTRTNPGILATSGQNLSSPTFGYNQFIISSTTGANAGRFTFNYALSAEL
jgi:hypothetical protein